MKKNNTNIPFAEAEKADIEKDRQIVGDLEKIEESLISEVEKLKAQVAEKDNHYKRALADYQNLEKRSFEMRSEWIRSAGRQVISRLLPVLDTLQMAQKHDQSQGLKISTAQFLDVLESEGVKRIETVGKQFDPLLMECIQTVEGEDGIVLEETRAGYTLDEKVLRVAQVIVGKKTVEKTIE